MIVWTRTKTLIAVAVLWAVIYLPGLGMLELQGEEGRRVLPAIDMLQGDSWVVPSVGGEDYFNKPPGINWLVAGAFKLTGTRSEWSARMVSAIFTLAFALVLVGMDSPFLSVPARLAGAVAFLTSIVMLEKGRLIEIEAVYTCLTGLAVVWWLNAFARGNQPWRQWIIPCLLLSYGVLVKGPFLAAPFYAVVICVLAYRRKLRQLFSIPHVVGIVLILAICGGWLYLAREQTNAAAMSSTMSRQVANRLLPSSVNVAHWVLAVLDSFPKLLPWALLLPMLWIPRFVANIRPEHLPIFRGLRLGWVLGFAALCLIPGLESRYTIPAWPTATVVLGWVLAEHKTPMPTDRIWRHAVLAMLTILPLATAAEMFKLGASLPAAALLAAAIAAALVALRLRDRLAGGLNLSLATGVLAALCVLNYVVLIAPVRIGYGSRRVAGAAVNALVPHGQTIYVYEPGYQSFLFYVRQPLRYVTKPDELTDRVRYLLMPTRHLRDPLPSAIASVAAGAAAAPCGPPGSMIFAAHGPLAGLKLEWSPPFRKPLDDWLESLEVDARLKRFHVETLETLHSIITLEQRNREAREGEFVLLRVRPAKTQPATETQRTQRTEE